MFYPQKKFFYNVENDGSGGSNAVADFYGKTNTEKPIVEKVEEVIEETPTLKLGAKENKEPVVVEKVETPEQKIDDAAFIAELKRRTGKEDVSDLFKVVVNEQEVKEKRDAEMFKWGVEQGILKKAELEGYAKANADPHKVVFDTLFEQEKKENPELSVDDFKEDFDNRFGRTSEEDSVEFKRGNRVLDALAKNIIESSFKNVVELESKFSSYEQQKNETEKRNTEILSKSSDYNKSIGEVKQELKNIEIPINGSDVPYKIEISDDAVEDYISYYLDKDVMKEQIKKGATKEDVKQGIINAIIIENFAKIAEDIGNKAVIRHKMGLKGIKPAIRVAADVVEDEVTQKKKEFYV